jgi:methylenetetrahydrofolate dehydrogenase (NADP+) / methenyltetrahydrofolate cyclohydrolase
MTARLLQGRPVADAIWDRAQHRAASLARPPRLAVVAGADESAAAYGRQIERQFTRRGLEIMHRTADASSLADVVRGLSADDAVDAILLLTPLPSGADPDAAALAIDPDKDVDGQHPFNLGRLSQRRGTIKLAPATALAGLRLLQHYQIPLVGARVVVVGRSPVVGMPLALLLIDADATVTICHSRTAELAAVTSEADMLCVAMGRPQSIGAQHVRPGAVVLDFGTHPTPDGGMLGDVQSAAVGEIASALTPVPGGIGPITVAVLAEQTVDLAHARRG